MLYFAYDATIHGDWASHYAVRLALHHPSQTLNLIHVDEGRLSPDQLDTRMHLLADRCQMVGVTLNIHREPVRASVFDQLDALVPTGPETYLLCGTRAHQRSLGYITGTAVERLLLARRRNVMAIRVLQPGILGCPASILVPVRGMPEGFAYGMPFLKLLVPDVTNLRLLMIKEVTPFAFRRLSHENSQRLHEEAAAYVQGIAAEIGKQFDVSKTHIEHETGVSDDVPKEIVICANRAKSQLIYLGASSRNLRDIFVYGNPIEQVLRNAPCDVGVYGACE